MLNHDSNTYVSSTIVNFKSSNFLTRKHAKCLLLTNTATAYSLIVDIVDSTFLFFSHSQCDCRADYSHRDATPHSFESIAFHLKMQWFQSFVRMILNSNPNQTFWLLFTLQEDLYVDPVVPVTPENITWHLKTDHLGNSTNVFILSIYFYI